MTALILDSIVSPVAAPARRPAPASRRRRHGYGISACRDVFPTGYRGMAGRSTTLPQRLYLTRRGLALAVALVAFLFVSMAVTLAVSWVAVSDSPLGRPGTFATSDGVLARG